MNNLEYEKKWKYFDSICIRAENYMVKQPIEYYESNVYNKKIIEDGLELQRIFVKEYNKNYKKFKLPEVRLSLYPGGYFTAGIFYKKDK